MMARATLCTLGLLAAASVANGAERVVHVPTDAQARYAILSVSTMRNGNLEVVTRRNGPSGESFSRREINCDQMTFRYTGEGDSLAELSSPYSKGAMGPLTEGSISTYVARAACRRR